MMSFRCSRVVAFGIWLVAALLFPAGALLAGGLIWEGWTRVCFGNDLSTEWLVANDKDWDGRFSPERVTIYLLIPPTVTKVEDHWEITFDPAGKKKPLLAEHFDNARASQPQPGGYKSWPTSRVFFTTNPKNYQEAWLAIQSKNHWAGKPEQPNADHDGTGTPYDYNLDPEDALGISFLEPTVTEKDGEWLLTVATAPTLEEVKRVNEGYAIWVRNHPGPRSPAPPTIRYPAKMQEGYDAWKKALQTAAHTGGTGLSSTLEDFFHLTLTQQKEYAAWQRAQTTWFVTGGATSYPQPIDFIHEDESQPQP